MSDEPSTYMDVVEILEARIRKAATEAAKVTAEEAAKIPYAPGTLIPTQEELGEEFGMHRATISRAIAILKDRSLLIGKPPVGVYVAKSI